MIHKDPNVGDQAMDLLMVAKYLERIGDSCLQYCRLGNLFHHRERMMRKNKTTKNAAKLFFS